jgi:hypothetical protein
MDTRKMEHHFNLGPPLVETVLFLSQQTLTIHREMKTYMEQDFIQRKRNALPQQDEKIYRFKIIYLKYSVHELNGKNTCL